MEAPEDDWHRILRRIFRASLAVLGDLLVSILLLGSLEALRYLGGGYVVFQGLPLEFRLEWIFDTAHVVLIVTFFVMSIWHFVREFWD